ncbi:cyclic lactone autoinducer peptide [Lysinibacillus sphaericus]|nr:cyclic lactone autoinducer peptide [Lysinibacillus sphaericus]MCS1384904.1 cyclic lactone autoinducer peptide [Lysinibacillus sphaericus]
MIDKLLEFIRIILINFGQHGTEQMCAGFLHEIKVPEELQDDFDY